ncbi:DUF2842 domain-containing protein [uncultured Erythrobacter sp.]|uniref:DUF2842 domain-containing protein n=1 Tax=uncultured Erythrobacter sp. TaxID=263913 RepID=UPI00261853BA|nr:DUF2842 domain-containing protein [uncultured Erythrobacter sp.]
MRETPTWRIPVGIIGLFLGLIVYGVLIAVYLADPLSTLPWYIQSVIYLILGVIWLLPLKKFLIWMETGKWGV